LLEAKSILYFLERERGEAILPNCSYEYIQQEFNILGDRFENNGSTPMKKKKKKKRERNQGEHGVVEISAIG